MKRSFHKAKVFVLFMMLFTSAVLLEAQNTEVTFVEDTSSLILNPERGWFRRDYGNSPEVVSDFGSVPNICTQQTFSAMKAEGITVFKHHWKIPRTTGISQAFLDSLRLECNRARQNGFKIIWRFSYNINVKSEPQDAPCWQILKHLDQLKPVFNENRDVIALLEAGFVGYWGEWHHSYYDNICPGGTRFNDSSRAIISKILEVLPRERMTGVRYPKTKINSLSNSCSGSDGGMNFPTPLAEATAYKGTDQARLGYWEQSWATNVFGSYTENEQQSAYVAEDTKFVPQWGEPAASSGRSWDGPTAIADAKKYHFSLINAYQGDTKSLMDKWKADGSYLTLAKYLGYRFRLISATCPENASSGNSLTLRIVMRNDGFASPFNPRLAMLVLRKQGSNTVYIAQANPVGSDTRLWLPSPDQQKTLICEIGIPSSMPRGKWDVLLWLPDPEETIINRPEYAIHLANKNVWEYETGFNKLNLTVSIKTSRGSAPYSGTIKFVPLSSMSYSKFKH